MSKVDEFLANEAKGTKIVGAKSLEDMVKKLKRPRRVMLLVKAGSAVQAMIDNIVPLLEQGDIIIDGGNSDYHDSNVSKYFCGEFCRTDRSLMRTKLINSLSVEILTQEIKNSKKYCENKYVF